MVGARIRDARTNRSLSLNEVATRAHISVATLSRIERDRQGLDLTLFLVLCKILRTAPQEMLGGDGADAAEPLALQIGELQHAERLQLWHDLADRRRGRSRIVAGRHILTEQLEELLAQFEFIRAQIESVQTRTRRN